MRFSIIAIIAGVIAASAALECSCQVKTVQKSCCDKYGGSLPVTGYCDVKDANSKAFKDCCKAQDSKAQCS
ncbi:hypothetical protein N7510_004689 [Penicillium lagena]|uniref:uncharacterized protein n=1 Tax=Penicillium lagena TaxID=94218 RepID=UPI0025422D1F|nr:uncharacterized protein N7510_004689 [Penicillium lagena]KAJ5620705.1 hypothetical protein N7510_004689 [Penicillium lagena]